MQQEIKTKMKISWQTFLFIFMLVLYMAAIVWTTVQTYARLSYNRSDWPEESTTKTE